MKFKVMISFVLFASFMGCSLDNDSKITNLESETISLNSRDVSNNELWATRSKKYVANNKHWVADIDGDGSDEIVYNEHGTRAYYSLSEGDENIEPKAWGYRNIAYTPGFSGTHWPVVTKDNKEGLVYAVNNGAKTYRVVTEDGDFYWGRRESNSLGFSGLHWVLDVDNDGVSDLIYNRAGTLDYKVINGATGKESSWSQRVTNNSVGCSGRHYPIKYIDKYGNSHNALVYNKAGSYDYYVLYNSEGRYHDDFWASRTTKSSLGLNRIHWPVDTNNDGYNDSLIYGISGSPDYNKLSTTDDVFWQTRTYSTHSNYEHYPVYSNNNFKLIYIKQSTYEYWSIDN